MDEQIEALAPLAFLASLAAVGDPTTLASLLGALEATLTGSTAEWAWTMAEVTAASPAPSTGPDVA